MDHSKAHIHDWYYVVQGPYLGIAADSSTSVAGIVIACNHSRTASVNHANHGMDPTWLKYASIKLCILGTVHLFGKISVKTQCCGIGKGQPFLNTDVYEYCNCLQSLDFRIRQIFSDQNSPIIYSCWSAHQVHKTSFGLPNWLLPALHQTILRRVHMQDFQDSPCR